MDTNRFFETLSRRSDADNAVIATLRRSLRSDPGTDARAMRLIEPLLPPQITKQKRQSVYLVAGLWALVNRRTNAKPQPLAAAMKSIADNSSIQSRFERLLDSDLDELPYRLRQAVTLIASKNVAIDWPQLLSDLHGWNWSSHSVQENWAKQFWRVELAPS